MTTKPKTRNAPAPIDPVFAAISEHKALMRESRRLGKSCVIERDKAEKEHGEWGRANFNSWPGEAIISPFYDRWNRAANAERKAAMRMARTKPTTFASVAALVAHAHRAIETGRDDRDWQGWVTKALKTISALERAALGRMEASPPSLSHLEASRAVLGLAAAARAAVMWFKCAWPHT
jgi:hypothetical protein